MKIIPVMVLGFVLILSFGCTSTEKDTVPAKENFQSFKGWYLEEYGVSEEYFDSHFEYVTTSEKKLEGYIEKGDIEGHLDGEDVKTTWDVTLVHYRFTIEDENGKEYMLEDFATFEGDEVIYLYSTDDVLLQGIVPIWPYGNRWVENEISLEVSSEEAVQIAHGKGCGDEPIELVVDFGKLVWEVGDCFVDAETGEAFGLYE